MGYVNFQIDGGWKVGPVYDSNKKQHPNLQSYKVLPDRVRIRFQGNSMANFRSWNFATSFTSIFSSYLFSQKLKFVCAMFFLWAGAQPEPVSHRRDATRNAGVGMDRRRGLIQSCRQEPDQEENVQTVTGGWPGGKLWNSTLKVAVAARSFLDAVKEQSFRMVCCQFCDACSDR